MKQRTRIWIIILTFLIALSCGRPDTLPTVAPTNTSAPKATSTVATGEVTEEPVGGDETPAPTEPAADDRMLRVNLLRATVQIVALGERGGRLQPMWTGSGTILSPDGMILTNAHVATDPDPRYMPDALGVAITVRSDDLPDLKYLAEVVAIDNSLDLAVIQIVSDLSGDLIDVEALNLDFVSIGDSDNLELGDLIQILGYPGIGGETITFTEGVVSGFTREPGVDGRAFVKTDATIAGGNSGGLAANLSGEIVGVPTQVGYGSAERFADCRYLADTNGDGNINENDNCIPVGGFINAIRPVNLAKPLVDAARLGIAPPPNKGDGPAQSSGESSFFNLVFASDVTDQDQPSQIVTQLSSGATHLYACWEYSGMTDGQLWEAKWFRDDEYLDDASWLPDAWKGGEDGSWWVSVYNDEGLTEGVYRIELYADDKLLVEDTIQVGGTVAGSSISNLVFSDGITEDEKPIDPTYLLPSGIDQVYAFFDFSDMTAGMAWSRVWYYEGEEVASKEATWEIDGSGSTWIGLSADEPLDPGNYRLELYVEGKLAAASNFSVAGTQSQDAIGPIAFAGGKDADGNPLNAGSSFAAGLTDLYFFVDYIGMQDGMRFEERWMFDGAELLSVDLEWDRGESGTFSDNIYRKNGDPLWEGEYTLELYVEGELVQSATAVIGGDAPPTPVPTPSDGLIIRGYVLDADTGQGISGALYVVLVPGVTVDDWEGDQDEIYTSAEADTDGYFELPEPLARGETYSIIVWAENYRPVTGDGLLVEDEISPLEVEIELQTE